MSEIETRCLDTFPKWLNSLADDATELATIVGDGAKPEAFRRYATASLNYLFKSLDLIPDGIEDLGFLDDAFVMRVAASLALEQQSADDAPKLAALAGETALIAELLGEDYPRLETYVKKLTSGAARGRTVDDILGDDQVRGEFLNEVAGWSKSYDAPTFTRDEKNLVKLKSFLSAKLPQA
ncbi:MAG: DUF1232 domain-containing protein [Deltaproteobacteria bacterium]|jgi:uncharacterized membrane protein YkvA (DUF1232 family)|nr:DUF1232 domain-containing protein [Deltaproteobacteria bacterium]MBW2532564.1 DUF1232 domain-containing protein [Deltaproteobacteria bacterium]